MMLNGGELNGARILSRKSVELMSHNHVQGKADGANAYGLGFGTTNDAQQLTELGSVGSFYWGGFYYTSFVIDPKEELVAIFMGQLHPDGGLKIDSQAITLAYEAIKD
jgi:CubicO group peptidase (beta-lactamase class C family)